jgi:hypothetical protein
VASSGTFDNGSSVSGATGCNKRQSFRRFLVEKDERGYDYRAAHTFYRFDRGSDQYREVILIKTAVKTCRAAVLDRWLLFPR